MNTPPSSPVSASDCAAESEDRSNRLHHLQQHIWGRCSTWAPHRVRACSVEFRPYAAFRNLVQLQDGRLEVRLSDVLIEAPREVAEAVTDELLARLFRRPPPPESRKLKRAFLKAPETRRRLRRLRRERSRLRMAPPAGDVWDLEKRFQELNQRYFDGFLRLDRLGWSLRKERSRLGRYDPDWNAVVLNRVLDSPLVPDYVVDYVLYHELIHAYLWHTIPGGPARPHGPEFQGWERRFSEHRRARAFLHRHFSRR